MKKIPATLGISPGTRHIGVAIIDNNLLHSRILTFPGPWSDRKLRAMQRTIIRLIRYNGVRQIAVKIPDKLPNTKAYNQLIGSMNRIAESESIPIMYFTLTELKKVHTGTSESTLKDLVDAVVKRYPELLPEYRREQRNKAGYYIKMFEAIAAAIYENSGQYSSLSRG